MGSSLKIIFDHFFSISVFWLLLLRFFLFLRNFHIFSIFFNYFTRSMKIIKGHRHWVLTEESPRLTTMAVFAGYYTSSLFPLPAFLNDVAGIHPGLIKLNEIKLLRIHVRGIRKSFPFNLHILKPVRRIRRRGSAVESQ